MNTRPFCPSPGSNKKVSVSSTSGSTNIGMYANTVRIVNSGSKLAYVRFGTGTITAADTDSPILASSSVVFYKDFADDVVAYVTGGSDTTTLHFQCGNGGV